MLCLFFFFSPPVLIGRFGLNPTFWLMNFSINATHFQLGILPSSLQIEAIIEKIKCSNNFKPLHTLQYYQCTSLFLKKGASSSGVLTIQAHRVYELIKHYQIIWNLYKSFGFPTLKANAVLNLGDARTWYAPNTRNTNILFEQRQSQALQMQQQKKNQLPHEWGVNFFFSDHKPEELGEVLPDFSAGGQLHAKPPRLPCCCRSVHKGFPLAKQLAQLSI